MLHQLLLAVSFVLFIVAALQPTSPNWSRFVAGGLALLVASMLL